MLTINIPPKCVTVPQIEQTTAKQTVLSSEQRRRILAAMTAFLIRHNLPTSHRFVEGHRQQIAYQAGLTLDDWRQVPESAEEINGGNRL